MQITAVASVEDAESRETPQGSGIPHRPRMQTVGDDTGEDLETSVGGDRNPDPNLQNCGDSQQDTLEANQSAAPPGEEPLGSPKKHGGQILNIANQTSMTQTSMIMMNADSAGKVINIANTTVRGDSSSFMSERRGPGTDSNINHMASDAAGCHDEKDMGGSPGASPGDDRKQDNVEANHSEAPLSEGPLESPKEPLQPRFDIVNKANTLRTTGSGVIFIGNESSSGIPNRPGIIVNESNRVTVGRDSIVYIGSRQGLDDITDRKRPRTRHNRNLHSTKRGQRL